MLDVPVFISDPKGVPTPQMKAGLTISCSLKRVLIFLSKGIVFLEEFEVPL